jgi:hypothetical protein
MRKRHWVLLVVVLVVSTLTWAMWEVYDNSRDRLVQMSIGAHRFAVPSRLMDPDQGWSLQRRDGARDHFSMQFDIAEALPDEPATSKRDRARLGRLLAALVIVERKPRSEFFSGLPGLVGIGAKLQNDKHYGLDAYEGRAGEILLGRSERMAESVLHECFKDAGSCMAYAWYGADLKVVYFFNPTYLDDWRQILAFVLDTLASYERGAEEGPPRPAGKS